MAWEVINDKTNRDHTFFPDLDWLSCGEWWQSWWQLVLGSQTSQSLLPHSFGGNGPPSATHRWQGGGGSGGHQEHICDVDSSTSRAYVNFFYSTIYISYIGFSTSKENMTLLSEFSKSTFYSQHAAATSYTSRTIFYDLLLLLSSTATFGLVVLRWTMTKSSSAYMTYKKLYALLC